MKHEHFQGCHHFETVRNWDVKALREVSEGPVPLRGVPGLGHSKYDQDCAIRPRHAALLVDLHSCRSQKMCHWAPEMCGWLKTHLEACRWIASKQPANTGTRIVTGAIVLSELWLAKFNAWGENQRAEERVNCHTKRTRKGGKACVIQRLTEEKEKEKENCPRTSF